MSPLIIIIYIRANHNVTHWPSLVLQDKIRCMLPSSGDAPSQHRWQPDISYPSVAACDIITLLLFGVFGGLLPCVMFACSLSHSSPLQKALPSDSPRAFLCSVRLTIVLHDVSVELTLSADWSLQCAANLVVVLHFLIVWHDLLYF